MRLAKERRIAQLQLNANSHRMSKAHTNALPFPRKRSSTKLAIIDPATGNTVHGEQALETWRCHMIKHLTDQPTRTTRDTLIDENYQPPDDHDDPDGPPPLIDDDDSSTLSSGSDTPEAMNTRRYRTKPARELLTEHTSSEEENHDTLHTTPTTVTPHSFHPNSSQQRQPTIREFFAETPRGYDEDFRKNIEAAVDEYVLEEESQPQQQDSPLNEPITLAHLKTAQNRLNSASCHAKDTIPNATLKI